VILLRTVAEVRRALAGGPPVAFVPTMGALHEGHLTLIRAARATGGRVVVSVFVNPTQFNDPADLAAYPRDEARDAALADEAGAEVVFAPSADEMYRPGHATTVRMRGAAEGFEGQLRPGHFDGVATVCLKLFEIVRPQRALFGQKDAQQAAVIRQLVRDLHLDLEIVIVPTVRDADGVALSSRNVRLSPDERARARAIPGALRAGLEAHRRGDDAAAAARAALEGFAIDYVAVAALDGEPTLLVAVRIGATRLIDNVPLSSPARAGLE
jgi:pantoate--beta-alanine ligase